MKRVPLLLKDGPHRGLAKPCRVELEEIKSGERNMDSFRAKDHTTADVSKISGPSLADNTVVSVGTGGLNK
jgi:hypothetical protein